MARRLSGWVDVELQVDANGATRDVQVVAAEPNNAAFKREALRAVARWRFQPKTIDGVPTATKLKRRLNFRMPG